VLQLELSFARCLVVATANVGRDLVTHIGFRPRTPPAATPQGDYGGELAPVAHTGHDEAVNLIEEALATLFDGDLAEVLDADRWLILPPLDERGMRRLVELRLALLGDLLPRGSPPIVCSDPAVQRLIAQAQEANAPNKTAALVDRLELTVEPAVNTALLRAGAPVPLAVRIDLDGDAVVAHVEPAARG
jgi:hypothetical protein